MAISNAIRSHARQADGPRQNPFESEDHDRFSTLPFCHELLHPIALANACFNLDIPTQTIFQSALVSRFQKFLSSLSVDVEGAAAEALDGRQDIVG